jgi:hypothetical protein
MIEDSGLFSMVIIAGCPECPAIMIALYSYSEWECGKVRITSIGIEDGGGMDKWVAELTV